MPTEINVGDRIVITGYEFGDEIGSVRSVIGLRTGKVDYYKGDDSTQRIFYSSDGYYEKYVEEHAGFRVGEEVKYRGEFFKIRFFRVNDQLVHLVNYGDVELKKIEKKFVVPEDSPLYSLKDLPYFENVYLDPQLREYDVESFKRVRMIIEKLFSRTDKREVRGYMMEWIKACPLDVLELFLEEILADRL